MFAQGAVGLHSLRCYNQVVIVLRLWQQGYLTEQTSCPRKMTYPNETGNAESDGTKQQWTNNSDSTAYTPGTGRDYNNQRGVTSRPRLPPPPNFGAPGYVALPPFSFHRCPPSSPHTCSRYCSRPQDLRVDLEF